MLSVWFYEGQFIKDTLIYTEFTSLQLKQMNPTEKEDMEERGFLPHSSGLFLSMEKKNSICASQTEEGGT